MSQQFLTESQEKTKQRIAPRKNSPASAQSFQGGLHPIPQLQRTLGNRRVAQLIQAKRLTPEGKIFGLQRKLTVGAADDQYEQEADRVAHQVMNIPDAAVTANSMQRAMSPEEDKDKMLQTKPLAASITPFVQREMVNNEEPEDKEKPVQAKFLTGTNRQPLQRQLETEEDKKEPIQAKSAGAQRAMSPEEDKDKMLQTKPLAASITPFVQRQMVNNEEPEDKEKPVQAKFLTGTNREPLQRQPETEEEETKPIQAKSAGSMSGSFEAGDDVETRVSQSKGRGSPLPDPVRAYMEPRFGVDFGQVRVHTGSDALQMNRDVGAQAFTHGSDIYFGAGHSPSNLELTAHELTHVIQQTGSPPLQTKNREGKVAPPGTESTMQRICAACAADDREKKGSDFHIAPVRQTLRASQIQGKWYFAGGKGNVGGSEGDSTSGNGSIDQSAICAPLTDLHNSCARARTNTWQSRGFWKATWGGRAKAFRWVTSTYTFKNDHNDADFLTLSGTGSISGFAKAEDLEYARGAALIVGRITENPQLNRTSAELFPPLKEGGISAASVGDLGEIDADVSIPGGKVGINIPLKKVKQGTQAPINDNNSPSYNVQNSVDEVDITIIVRADADADIEDETWIGDLDENTATVAASFFLDWKSRSGSGTVPPGRTSEGTEPGTLGGTGVSSVPKCGMNPESTPKGTIVPKKGKYKDKKVTYQHRNGKHTKVAGCSVSELVTATAIDPAQLEGELRKFVQACKDKEKSYGSQLGKEGSSNYGKLMLEALENGDENDRFKTTTSEDIGDIGLKLGGKGCAASKTYEVMDDLADDPKAQFHLYPV